MPDTTVLCYEDVEVGTAIPTLEIKPTVMQIFRYSAVTWNHHRIHYDKERAIQEGHPDVLVTGHLLAAFLFQMVMSWAGPTGKIKKMSYANRHRSVPGDVLTCKGTVVKKYEENGEFLIDCELAEENQDGVVCVPGKMTISLPRKGLIKIGAC